MHVLAYSPGDGDPFCTQLSSAVTPPIYPPNSRILMDSLHYLNLLSPLPSISSAWQEVDVDGNRDSNNGVTEVSS